VVPPGSDRVSRERSYSGTRSAGQRAFVYGTIALCGARFHTLRLTPGLVTAAGSDTIRTRALRPRTGNACPLTPARFRLVPFRSPLLGESRLIFFRRGTEMCQFPRLPSRTYVFSPGWRRITGAGFSHSEIHGSKVVQHLTVAYRSRPRPSSSPGAKASTVCPYYLDGELPTRETRVSSASYPAPPS
jgi:hypothetical protein